MPIPFNSSATHTLGVEIEMGLVHDETDELECAAPTVLAEVCAPYPDGVHPRIHRELFQSTLELVTGVCETPADAHADLAATVAELAPILRRHHLALIGTGVHPLSLRPVQNVRRLGGVLVACQCDAERLVAVVCRPGGEAVTAGREVPVEFLLA